jgi:hypothetical protein
MSEGDINTETWFSRLGVGRKPDDHALQKIIVAKFKEVKGGWSTDKNGGIL